MLTDDANARDGCARCDRENDGVPNSLSLYAIAKEGADAGANSDWWAGACPCTCVQIKATWTTRGGGGLVFRATGRTFVMLFIVIVAQTLLVDAKGGLRIVAEG